jgi:predicted aspartyl protease
MRQWMLCATLAMGSALGGPVQGQELNKPETAVAVPFDLVSNFLVVAQGQAGSLDGLKFIVDTGATRSVIDRKVAVRLQLKRHPGRIMNLDRYIPIEWAELAELRMGPLRAEHLRVMVVNLGEYSEFGKGADGIVGLDLLSNSEKFTIDYGEKKLYFEPAANGNHRPVPGSFIVPIVVQGVAMRLVVDTGLSDILLFGDRLKRRPIKIRTEGEPETVAMGRIGGTRVILPGVQIGGPEESIAVVLINGPGERMLPGLDGFFGTSSLHTKYIEFDFDKMILRWQ